MAYFTSTTPLAATLSATHTLPAAGDSHFGYEAAYPATLPGDIEASCIPTVAAAYTPGDTHYPRQQAYMQEMGVDYLWLRGLAGARPGNPIVVAVIDTGVDLTHPDLAPNLVPGYDFVEDDDTPQDTSRTGHGTRVAGIIAAPINNAPAVRAAASLGVAGIGGGNPLSGTTGLKIMPLRIATDTVAVDCLLSAQAIDYARTHGAQIINMSYGDGEACPEEMAAIERAHAAGMALVAGAGNENSSAPFYPAAYGAGANDDLVIAVAGLDPGGRKGPLSNYGPWVDLSAPYRAFSTATGGGYSWETGTSFAAPFVSGLIGVLMSNYGWSHTQAIDALRSTASNVNGQNPDYAGQLGAGRIDAGRASLAGTVVGNELFLPTVRRE
jgi:thermitase